MPKKSNVTITIKLDPKVEEIIKKATQQLQLVAKLLKEAIEKGITHAKFFKN